MYRGKRIDGKGWVFGSLLGGRLCHIMSHKPIERTESTSMFAGNEVVPVHPNSVGQSTGLKDNNGEGTESYHKDICRYRDDSGKGQTGSIEWSETGARFYIHAVGGDDEGNQDGDLDRWFFVIGNVTDNPGLLEVK